MVDIFGNTLVDGVGRTNKVWTVTGSFAGQVIAVGVWTLIPLIFTDVLPRVQAVNMLTAPPPAPSSFTPSYSSESDRQTTAPPVRGGPFDGAERDSKARSDD